MSNQCGVIGPFRRVGAAGIAGRDQGREIVRFWLTFFLFLGIFIAHDRKSHRFIGWRLSRNL